MALIKLPSVSRNSLNARLRCTLVDSEESMQQVERVLRAHTLIAFDTESNSFHSYKPRVCLLQLAVQSGSLNGQPGTTLIFLLDPDLVNLRRLRPIFEDSTKTFIAHSLHNDLGQLWSEFGLRISTVFDTQIAARLAGYRSTGLAAILSEHFDVDQQKKAQISDWGRRPFTQSQLKYACEDVIYLIPLYRKLLSALRIRNQLPEAMAIMQELARRDYSRFGSPSKTFWDHQATKRVPLELMNVYRSLWEWRESEARRVDCPRVKILGDEALLLLTLKQPLDRTALSLCGALKSGKQRKYGDHLLQAIRDGQRREIPVPPVGKMKPNPSLQARRQASLFSELRKWRWNKSRQRGVDPDIVLSKYALQVIAEAAPASLEALAQHKLLGDWKLQQYGKELVGIVRSFANSTH